MKRLLGTCIALSLVTLAMALSAYSKVFQEKYHVKEGSALAKAACGVCHVGAKGGKLNAYGKDVQAAMKAAGSKKVTAAILAKVEGLDSNKNGVKNIDEIKKDHNPGE
ncbi:MAG: hypothetical protein JSS66_08085 [Armatimonadetes bacterium]|nr:hypothetical protein [Armatimonadota bacterium]